MEIYELSEKNVGGIMNELALRVETLKKGMAGLEGVTIG
jgi:hypothetical protein